MNGITFKIPPSEAPPTDRYFESAPELAIRSLSCAIRGGEDANVIAHASLDFEHYVESFDVAGEFIVEPFPGLPFPSEMTLGDYRAFRGRARVTSDGIAPTQAAMISTEGGKELIVKAFAFRIVAGEVVTGIVRTDLECFESGQAGNDRDKWATIEEFEAALHGYPIGDSELGELRQLLENRDEIFTVK